MEGQRMERRMEGQTDPILKDPSVYRRGSKKHKTVTSNLTQSNQIFCSWLFLVLKLMRDGVII